jgi:hypothetical protein
MLSGTPKGSSGVAEKSGVKVREAPEMLKRFAPTALLVAVA